jgi:hypothetical protein
VSGYQADQNHAPEVRIGKFALYEEIAGRNPSPMVLGPGAEHIGRVDVQGVIEVWVMPGEIVHEGDRTRTSAVK